MHRSRRATLRAPERILRSPIVFVTNSQRWELLSKIPKKAPPGRSRDDQARHAVPKTLALLHLHQMGADHRRAHPRVETCLGCRGVMAQTMPKPALRPFLAADVPILAAIFIAAIEELTVDDYSEAQREAWARAADDEEQFGRRLADELTLIATLQNSPVGFASLKGADHIDMLYVHPGAAGQGVASMLCDALEKLAGGRGAKSLTVDASDPAQEFFAKRGSLPK